MKYQDMRDGEIYTLQREKINDVILQRTSGSRFSVSRYIFDNYYTRV